jgi:CRISPR-associated endonuclease Csn1
MFKEPQGIIWIKEKREVSVVDAFKIQIERMKVEHDKERRKITSYVYDQLARPIIKDIIERIGIDLDDTNNLLNEINKHLINNSKKVETGKLKKDGKHENKTVYLLQDYEYEKIEIAEFVEYAAKRVKLDNSFTHDKINKTPYAKESNSPLAGLLHEHLKAYNDNSNEAFAGEGLEILTKKAGKRLEKITIYEKKSPDDKFGKKYVEVDKGAIAYFIIYEDEQTKKRPEMYSMATHKAIERLVHGMSIADKKEGFKTMILSPDDLVYVPTKDELKRINAYEQNPINWNDKKRIAERIYRMNSSTGSKCEFVPHRFVNQNPIIDKIEFGANNINQRAWDGIVKLVSNKKEGFKREDSGTMIKDVCIKIEVDRLGNIKPVNN